ARHRGGVELEQQVGSATLLERAGHLEVLELDEAASAAQLRERLGVGAGRLIDRALEPFACGRDVRRFEHRSQKGTRGSSRAGDMIATGISRVEVAYPGRPRQSIRMSPPWPTPSSTSRSTATFAAQSGSSASLRYRRARWPRTTRMIASPSPVHDTPP